MGKIVLNHDLRCEHVELHVSKNVLVRLSNKTYNNLVSELCVELKADIERSKARDSRSDERRNNCINFIGEIRSVFYENLSDDYMLKKTLEDIDKTILDDVLDKYSQLLGFE